MKTKKTVKKKRKVDCGYCGFKLIKGLCLRCASPVDLQNNMKPVEISPDLHIEKISFEFDPKKDRQMWHEWIEIKAQIYIDQKFFDAKERSVLRFTVPVSEDLKKVIYSYCRIELNKILKKEFLLPRGNDNKNND